MQAFSQGRVGWGWGLREAVKNGLLKDAFREREKDEEDVSIIETSEARTIAHNPSDAFGPRKMFRKAWENLIATSTSPMDRKLVGNLSLVWHWSPKLVWNMF